jgi:hypothetical protein
MNDKEIRRLAMMTRARDFGSNNSTLIPADSLAGKLLAIISKIVNELTSYAVKESSGNETAQRGTASKTFLRDELHEDMLAISRTARFMRVDELEFEKKFRMPRGVSDQVLLTTARRFAEDAIPYISEFIQRELPDNFIEEFNNKIKLFEKAVSDQNLGTGNRVVASAAIDESIDRGMDAVKELDSIIRNKFRKDQAMLEAWESASHVERAPRPVVVDETPESETTGK